jgi:hypothetical protein
MLILQGTSTLTTDGVWYKIDIKHMNTYSYDKLFADTLPGSIPELDHAPGTWNTLEGYWEGGQQHSPRRKAWNPNH